MTDRDKYAKLYEILSKNPKITAKELRAEKLVTGMEMNDLTRKGYVLTIKEVSYSPLRTKEEFEELDHIRSEVKLDEIKLRKIRG